MNLKLLKDLVKELEENSPTSMDRSERYIQVSKCVGLLGGIINESTNLMYDLTGSTKENKEESFEFKPLNNKIN